MPMDGRVMKTLDQRAVQLAMNSLLTEGSAAIVVQSVYRASPHDDVRESMLHAVLMLSLHGVDEVDIVIAVGAFTHVLVLGKNGTASSVAADVLRHLDRDMGVK